MPVEKDTPTSGSTPGVVPLTFDQLKDLISSSVAAGVKVATEGAADVHADAMKRALKPENAFSPMKSAFNPAGDMDHPRPALKAVFTLFDGIPIDGTTDTVEEITLLNQLEHGEYFVPKADGTRMPFRVKEIKNDMGQLQRVDIWFPYRDEADRAGVLPMVLWLRDVVGQIQARKSAAVVA